MKSIGILCSWLLMACFVVVFVLILAPHVHCQIIWNGPRLTPAEAADVLRRAPGLANVANQPTPIPEGPTVVISGSRPGAASWLDFPAPYPARRLDGTPAWWPPTVYGGNLRMGHGRNYGHISSPIVRPGISHQSTWPRR